MPTDVYVKFGDTKEVIGPLSSPRPKIEGDSTDALHYWWCELRTCGFDLEAKDPKPDPAEASTTKPEEESKAKFHKVKLTKRVDWASTQLFRKCCEQAMALSKSKDEQEKCWIDKVTVEVCRPAGGTKLPFVILEYHQVRITNYSIDIASAEPAESITFEFQKLLFRHTRTDPYTGDEAFEDSKTSTGLLANSATGQSSTAQGSGSEPGPAPAPAPGAGPTSGGGTNNSGTNTTPAVPTTNIVYAGYGQEEGELA